MKVVELRFSKSQIDRAGEALKQDCSEQIGSALEILSNWRAYHVMPLGTFAKVLRTRANKIAGSEDLAIVAQRLKRTPSILIKLKRHSTMRLSAMQDIGGLRAVFENVSKVYELVDLYRKSKTRHQLFAIHDYIANPKRDGYRSVHLVYKLDRVPSLFLEIQVRSYLQHIWATGVEVFGTLQNSSFKSGHGSEEWLRFFSLLSSVFAIKEGQQVVEEHRSLTKKQIYSRTVTLIRKLNVSELLNAYTTLYRITSEDREKGRQGHYSLVALNSHDNTISVSTFSASQIDEATKMYAQLEKKFFNDINMNVVLVNSGDIKKLEQSYPNYFMDTKILVRYLSEIVLETF